MTPRVKKILLFAGFGFLAWYLYNKMQSAPGNNSGNPATFSGNGYDSGYATQGKYIPSVDPFSSLLATWKQFFNKTIVSTVPTPPPGKNPGYTMVIGDMKTGSSYKKWMSDNVVPQPTSSLNPSPINMKQLPIKNKSKLGL